jgi:hypothetical protein
MMATYPVGGVAWDYGQYALAMEQLGYEVYYLEDTALPAYTYDDDARTFVEDPSYGIEFLRRSLAYFSPTLADRWFFRAYDGRTFGMDEEAFNDIVAGADVLLNVSGGTLLREPYRRCPVKVFIDTDPGWNQFVIFPRWDAKPRHVQLEGYRGHDAFFTFAERIGQPDCPLDTFGLEWHTTRHPVITSRWPIASSPGDRWTTVMMWNNYEKPVTHEGVQYGSKEREFAKIEPVPSRVRGAKFEVAINGEAPIERWRGLGWSTTVGGQVSKTAQSYRDYVAGSRGEFSVAKNIYVATHSGWFSGRSACYLAAGRPVVLQDTGYSQGVSTGEGLLSFRDGDEAVAALSRIERDYARHSRAARRLAEEHFEGTRVLGEILQKIGLEIGAPT